MMAELRVYCHESAGAQLTTQILARLRMTAVFR
jgi:hypothetical protein